MSFHAGQISLYAKTHTTITLTQDTLFVDGTDIDVADLNGDTIQDLVVAIPTNGSRTAILIGNGDGTFQPARIISEPRLRVPQYQVIADFNRDGFLISRLRWQTAQKVYLRSSMETAMALLARRFCTSRRRPSRASVAARW